MAASFRSHFRHPPSKEEPASQSQRKPSSRIPAKSSSGNTDNKQSKTAQHVSRLAKRASRSITPSEQTEHVTNQTRKASDPVTAASNTHTGAKRFPTIPSSEVATVGRSATSMSRSGDGLPLPSTIRTPSLISGSSASTFDSPRTNGLRRKPSTIEKYAASKRAEAEVLEAQGSSVSRTLDELDDAFENSVLGISLPQTTSVMHNGAYMPSNPKYRLPSDVDPAEQIVMRDITPPVPHYAPSATPSTRYTDSPFSHVPTPSSASSYSSAVVATTNGSTSRLRQQSPTRNRTPQANHESERKDSNRLGLPPVRESSTSSSNATVKSSLPKPAAPQREVPRKSATAPPTGKAAENQRPTSRGKLTKERPKQPASSSKAKAPVQIPPELAHLNVDPPTKASSDKALPPIRPSRDGTPSLTDLKGPSPVVQSDLPKVYTTYHKRTSSQESNNLTSPLKSRFGLSPNASSQQSSPRIDSAISPPPAARAFARGPTPDAMPNERHRPTRKDSPAIGPAPSPSKSPRFGFFSRKPKTDSSKPTEKPKRQATKGPAAGTGHEGYGRFGVRGRSGSTGSSVGFRSPSADSNTSSVPPKPTQGRKSSVSSKDGSEMDDFLRERLNPVVLRGSGSTISNTASISDNAVASAPDSKSSSLDSYPKPQLLPSAMSSTAGMSPSKRPATAGRAGSESSEDEITQRYPTLAARRSLTRLSQGEGKSAVKMPAPIDTGRPSKDSSLDSYESEYSGWAHTEKSIPPEGALEGKEGQWLRPRDVEPEVKSPRKWNFFQRAQASPRRKGKEKATVTTDLPEPVLRSSPYRDVAHYAMLDPVAPVGLEEVERIVQEPETSPEDSMSDSNRPSKVVPYERRHKSLLPSPPKGGYRKDYNLRPNIPAHNPKQSSSEPTVPSRAHQEPPYHTPHLGDILRSPLTSEPEEMTETRTAPRITMDQPRTDVHTPEMLHASLNTPENQDEKESPRQPRLSPIGRIPKVVSKRDRDRKLSDSSFSRPFARTQPRPSVKPPGILYNQIRELASPIESGSQPVSSTSTRSDGVSGEHKSSVNTNPQSLSTNRTSMDVHSNSEFFVLPPRKDSDMSYSTSSGNSWMAMMVPPPPQMEDVWHEYNDLLDEVLPEATPLSAGSSLGAPFQYTSMLYEPYDVAHLSPFNWNPPSTQLPAPPPSRTAPPVLSVPQQIARFMQPSMSPLTTPNSEFVDHYGNRSTSTLITPIRTSIPGPRPVSQTAPTKSNIPGPNRSSIPQGSRSSVPSARGSVASSRVSRASGHSRSASLPEANARNSQSSLSSSARFTRDTQLLDIAEVDGDDQAAAANLRFGALMTSKWLSFGRVLFSPAHNEMRLTDDPKVLIIDGLGSDWSYYVALSYPAATVYNLGPPPPNGTSSWPGVDQKPPANHRHINHVAISASFPFPKGFFTAVVFRFPLVVTDEAYQAAIFECKRVLRPGGYLEVAVLDLDLMNMGTKARRAVRGLKTRMQQRDQNISLRNLSDLLIRLIGRRGFEEVQRCIVGVPAAGRIPRSQDMSSISSGASGKPVWPREEREGQEFSFADLLEDARASQIDSSKNNDESITKMVAKVGRWWYSTCYEKLLLQSDSCSIWNDPTLLRECEKQGTSFRLLICHAQKPTQTRRRTVSV